MQQKITNIVFESIKTKQRLLKDSDLINTIQSVVACMVEAFKNDKKILFCGNGGSAADAQHIAAELSGRFYQDRAPLFAEALHVNTSFLTAVANDYGYAQAFARMVQAAGRKGDILVAISTSGNSDNILNAVNQGIQQGMIVVGMTGESGGKMKDKCDFLINIPSNDTPRIQEAHILVGHILCELVEKELFGANENMNIYKNWTLFLDRDGVINHKLDNDYVKNPKEFRFLRGVPAAIAQFSQIFGRIIVVTNQQGVGKGLMTEQDLDAIHQKMLRGVQKAGGRIDKIYHAPTLKAHNSELRKPNTGMALQAQRDFPEIDFQKSIMVGDSLSDMEFGHRLGMKTVFLSKNKIEESSLNIDFQCGSLLDVLKMLNR
jgi:D-sedoheptulose 7-phosphate isomerase